jgi:hypothetical protein
MGVNGGQEANGGKGERGFFHVFGFRVREVNRGGPWH